MKVVINTCWGGFGVSRECAEWMAERGHVGAREALAQEKFYGYFIDDRTDPALIQAIETLGAEPCSGPHAKLKIVEIPDGTQYEIDDYDGKESIHEVHESWS
jgi:hypothetical protein